MKKIFKKNQVIITALAIMIAVAGYLNFTSDKQVLTTSGDNVHQEGAKGNEDDAAISAAVEDTASGWRTDRFGISWRGGTHKWFGYIIAGKTESGTDQIKSKRNAFRNSK